MHTLTLDFETYWSQEHSLSKMFPPSYVMHPETEIISCSAKVNDEPTICVFGEDEARRLLVECGIERSLAIGHNMSMFDSMIVGWRLKLNPRMYGCTLAMARPVHAGLSVGGSLAKLVEHYKLGVKDNTVLLQTKGRHLADFTPEERRAMVKYNSEDTDQCYGLFQKLKPHFSAKELWHIDCNIRMLAEPKFTLNTPMLEAALSAERDLKRKSLMDLSKLLGVKWFTDDGEARGSEEVLEEVRSQLASAPKFCMILEARGVEVPTKKNDKGNDIPALAKTDEGFIALQEHDDPVVAAAARARLSVKSTQLETRIGRFLELDTATKHWPVALNYCGADTTGRDSGAMGYNAQNLPRVTPGQPRNADALRNCIEVPDGYKVFVADQSGIELRVNHFLWKVQSTMDLYNSDPAADLYRNAGSILHGVPPEEITKGQRQIEKIKQLGLGFGAGPATFRGVAKVMGGLDIDLEQSKEFVDSWRRMYIEIVKGWRTCHNALQDIYEGRESTIDPWGLCITCKQGIRLPSGRLIRYPNLREEWNEKDQRFEWTYGQGRFATRIYAGKVDENIVQALARDTLFDNAVLFFKETGMRPSLKVHDELVYVGRDADCEAHLETLQEIMRRPPSWWPQLVTWSEGSVAHTYGQAK